MGKTFGDLKVGDSIYVFCNWRGNKILESHISSILEGRGSSGVVGYVARGPKNEFFVFSVKDPSCLVAWDKRNETLGAIDKDVAKAEARDFYLREIEKLQKKMKYIPIKYQQ